MAAVAAIEATPYMEAMLSSPWLQHNNGVSTS
jgi:hypothetical protein